MSQAGRAGRDIDGDGSIGTFAILPSALAGAHGIFSEGGQGVLEGFDLVIVGPGPGDPRDDADPKMGQLRAAVDWLMAHEKPFLAVCLGHQALCHRLGLGLHYKDIVFQGTQSTLRVDGRRERVGFYNTFVGRVGDAVLPEGVEVDADPETGRVVFGFSSFVHAPSMQLWTPRTRALTELAAVDVPVDLSQLELTQERVPSRDGTLINVHLLHRRGLERNGQNPVVLNGYGGFNVSLLPGFQRNPLYWAAQGGVYAVVALL